MKKIIPPLASAGFEAGKIVNLTVQALNLRKQWSLIFSETDITADDR